MILLLKNINPDKMIKKYGIIIVLLVSGSVQAQLMEKIKTRSGGGDPANPTSLFTRYDFQFINSIYF